MALNYFNYFTEIEDAFVRRRGRHLLLSPADWALIESWKEKGIPLYVALRGIERAFDSYEAKPRRRSVKSLFYCQEEVEAQYDEWRESQLGAAPPSANGNNEGGETAAPAGDESALPFPREVISAHLDRVRDTLAELSQRGGADDFGAALERAVARLDEVRADFGRAARPRAEAIEDELTQLETLLDGSLRTSLPAEEIEKARATAAGQLRPYRDKMDGQIYTQTLENLVAKSLRETAGVPRLSLFYL